MSVVIYAVAFRDSSRCSIPFREKLFFNESIGGLRSQSLEPTMAYRPKPFGIHRLPADIPDELVLKGAAKLDYHGGLLLCVSNIKVAQQGNRWGCSLLFQSSRHRTPPSVVWRAVWYLSTAAQVQVLVAYQQCPTVWHSWVMFGQRSSALSTGLQLRPWGGLFHCMKLRNSETGPADITKLVIFTCISRSRKRT